MKRFPLVSLVVMFVFLVALVSLPWRHWRKYAMVVSASRRILASCKTEQDRSSCYDRAVPLLLGRLTMEQAFRVLERLQNADPAYLYCHVVAHKLSFAESARDPSRWKDVLTRCPSARCNYGCLHGSLMQRFQNEVLTDQQITEARADLRSVCESRPGFFPTQLDRSMCYHAMGHLAMFLTGADLDRASSVCYKLTDGLEGYDLLGTCLEGVFMTVFQGVEPEDFVLVIKIKPRPEEVATFCGRQDDRERRACFRESYPLFANQMQTPEGGKAFCSYAWDEESREDCFRILITVLTTNWFSEKDGQENLASYCRGIPPEYGERCYAWAATRLVQIDPIRQLTEAVAVCNRLAGFGDATPCFADLVAYADQSFHPEALDRTRYCQKLPHPWRDACREGNP